MCETQAQEVLGVILILSGPVELFTLVWLMISWTCTEASCVSAACRLLMRMFIILFVMLHSVCFIVLLIFW